MVIEICNYFTQGLRNRTRINSDTCLMNLERLAFIGDGILYEVASEYVYNKFKDETVKENLHKEREKYKQNKNLKKITDYDDLVQYFWIAGNTVYGSKTWIHLMGTFIEAIIGAVYLDKQNIKSAKRFIENYIIPNIDTILSTHSQQ